MSAEIIARLELAFANSYVIEREVGRGGMATVYLGRDVRHNRPVAIKVLHPELAASMGSDRFLREIRLAATLQHPHILGLYDSGDAGGLLYYVMPFVEGESLRDRLDREKQLPIDDALQIAREAASALAYAHSKGIVHRDIKPENVLLADGHAIVMDFGIAHAAQDAGAEKLTQTGMSVGTPLYMSPEQAAGERDLDGRSDIYSLGCVLYEMLIGEPPFRGPTALAILARHSMEAVPSLQIVRNTVPDEVEDAVMCALAKAPADRYANATQFEKALLLPSTTVSHRATSRAMRAQTGTRRAAVPLMHRRWAVVAAGVAFAVLAYGTVAWQRSRDDQQKRRSSSLNKNRVAVLPFTADTSLAYIADGLTDALTAQLTRVRQLVVSTPAAVRSFTKDTVSTDSIARALNVGTLVQGAVERVRGDSVRVIVKLLDASGAATSDAKSFVTSRAKLLALRDSVADAVAFMTRGQISREITLQHDAEGANNADAWALVQRARQNRRRAQELAHSPDTAAVTREFVVADSFARLAQASDPKWSEPITLRGWIEYDQSRRFGTNAALAAPHIERGLPLADSAMALDSSADNLELRGDLKYWKYLLSLGKTDEEQNHLIDSAQHDLEESRTRNANQAGALASLSHLYARSDRLLDAIVAAKQALEADAYVSNADVILYRIFLSSWDLGRLDDAQRACNEGAARFPKDYRFYDCQIMVMASGLGPEPDIARAWDLVSKADSAMPVQLRPFWTRAVRVWTAGVIAQASKRGGPSRKQLADSARHVLANARADAVIDPRRGLSQWSAVVDAILGDNDAAVENLKDWYAANPSGTLRVRANAGGPGEVSWMFRDLQRDPRLQPLFAQRTK